MPDTEASPPPTYAELQALRLAALSFRVALDESLRKPEDKVPMLKLGVALERLDLAIVAVAGPVTMGDVEK